MKRAAVFLFALCLALPAAARAEEEVKLRFSRQELEAKWRERIQALLAKGVIPFIDMESSFPNRSEPYVDEALRAMDEVGLALIAFDGQQAPPDGVSKKGDLRDRPRFSPKYRAKPRPAPQGA